MTGRDQARGAAVPRIGHGARGIARCLLLSGVLSSCLSEPPAATGVETAASRFAAAWRTGDCDALLAMASGFVATTDTALDTATVWAGSCLRRTSRPLDALVTLAPVADAAPPRRATPRARLERGRTLHAIGDFGGAHSEFTHIISDFPRHSQRDEAVYYDGKALRRQGDLDAAVARFDAVLADDRSSPSRRGGAAYQLGLIASERGLVAEAAAWFEMVIDADPASASAFRAGVKRATISAIEGDCAGAESALLAFTASYPDPSQHPRLDLEHADLVRQCGDVDRAEPLYAALWTADSVVADDAGYALGRIAFGRARDADVVDDPIGDVLYGEARARFELLLSRFPDSNKATGARLYLGRIFIELREFEVALAQLARVLEDRASSSWESALYHVSWAQYVKGDLTGLRSAITGFEEVISLPGPSRFADDATYYRARAFMRTGQDAAALAAFEALEGDFPASSFLDNALYQRVVLSVSSGDCSSASGMRDRLHLEHPSSPYFADVDALVAACVSL